MSMKKVLAGAILASGAILAPFAKGDTKQTDTKPVANTQEAGKTDKISMPSWIPTTADGKFDKKTAEIQFDMIWNKNGKDIQQYANDIKSGIPEEIAYTKFAHKLANGDKEKEQQILALHDVVKETGEKREGNMQNTPLEKWLGPIMFGFVMAALTTVIKFTKKANKIAEGGFKEPIPTTGALWMHFATQGILNATVNTAIWTTGIIPPEMKRVFINAEEKFCNEYQKIDTKKKYTMTDMQTAKQMIKMAQEAKRC